MAKGYSVRRTENYYRSTKDGQWKGHSIGVWDKNGYTRIFPTIESAEAFIAQDKAKNRTERTPDEQFWTQYWTIYFGKDKIKVIS